MSGSLAELSNSPENTNSIFGKAQRALDLIGTSITRLVTLDAGTEELRARLLTAATDGDVTMAKACVRAMLELPSAGLSPRNCRDAGGRTPLMMASISGHPEIVRLLLTQGDVGATATTNFGTTALMKSVWSKKHSAEIVQLLLDHGAQVAPRNADGNTALIMAGAAGNLAAVQLLLANGAAVNAQNKNGEQMVWQRLWVLTYLCGARWLSVDECQLFGPREDGNAKSGSYMCRGLANQR
jgi:ankyrin repeat protein